MENILDYKEIINGKPIHLATVTPDNKPNLSVSSNNIVINENTIIISINEMINTQNNIINNKNIVITAFDENWKGIRVFGEAKFKTDGEYYDLCEKTFFVNGKISPFGATKPKGVLIVHVNKIEKFV